MTIKPGMVFRVDLGMGGKVRPMLVVSREDREPPRALCLCVPITTSWRESSYEVELPRVPFLREKSYANVQGIQPIRFHELTDRPLGSFRGNVMEEVRVALRFALDL